MLRERLAIYPHLEGTGEGALAAGDRKFLNRKLNQLLFLILSQGVFYFRFAFLGSVKPGRRSVHKRSELALPACLEPHFLSDLNISQMKRELSRGQFWFHCRIFEGTV